MILLCYPLSVSSIRPNPGCSSASFRLGDAYWSTHMSILGGKKNSSCSFSSQNKLPCEGQASRSKGQRSSCSVSNISAWFPCEVSFIFQATVVITWHLYFLLLMNISLLPPPPLLLLLQVLHPIRPPPLLSSLTAFKERISSHSGPP